MELTRRGVMALGAGVAAATLLPAFPARAAVEDAIAEFTGGAAVGEGGITLSTPSQKVLRTTLGGSGKASRDWK